ncbi:hypothetical protein PB01_15085 [Psychrobacillus glaciei]|uniref:Uncharacterized protein n=1 Tax=Psychrobacillus glaciei TaxID=2283160 RepID=A0A5J6SQ23_9BACI|nr:hypothetical protein [Psychrobacillus glaciei]QFG00042.1 hypothetical protein PB01_15085 [Psychrobacillus glaciei]
MATLKMSFFIATEIIIYLILGLVLTENGLRVIYENSGIPFLGNVWVNWFGVSYLLFFFYTMIRRLFFQKNNAFYSERAKSIVFWMLFFVSIYVVFIPFYLGKNPF